DFAYVHNFKVSDRPRLLTFTAGQGRSFRDTIHALVAGLKKTVTAVFESEDYAHERKAVLDGYKDRQKEMLKDFEARVEKEGLRLVQIQMGPIVRPSLVPVVDGEIASQDRLEESVKAGRLSQAEVERIG